MWSVAREWFAEHGRRRFVSMVHFYSTHTPSDPPEEYRRLYVDPAEIGSGSGLAPLRQLGVKHVLEDSSGTGGAAVAALSRQVERRPGHPNLCACHRL